MIHGCRCGAARCKLRPTDRSSPPVWALRVGALSLPRIDPRPVDGRPCRQPLAASLAGAEIR